MGYISIPKLISGGGDEPVITTREMPQEWQYFKTLAEGKYDQCYLFYKGGAATFAIDGFVGNDSYATLYGGLDGMQPLYRFYWSASAGNRYWATYINGEWVKNPTQSPITNINRCDLIYADLDNYPLPFPITLNDIQGKPIVDEHLGATELFTVVTHMELDDRTNAKLAAQYADGGSATNSPYAYPLVAYYGPSNGIKASNAVRIPDLEFIEFTEYGTATFQYFAQKAYYLGKVSMPDNITTLNTGAFNDCYYLQEVKLPKNIINIPDLMFQNCYNLKKITLGDKIETIEDSAFRSTKSIKKLTLPDTVKSLGQYCFAQSSIKELNFPSSLETISNYCFQESNIQEAILPDTLQTLGTYAFSKCTHITKVHLPSTLTEISTNLFSECNMLQDVNLPSGLTTVGSNAFYQCYISEIEIPNTVTSIGNNAFEYCHKLQKVIIPNGCTIGTFAFGYCENLKEVKLPNDLTTLANSLFVQCKSIESYDLPNTLVTIGSSVFANNFNVKNLIIPAGVTSIAANAFAYMGACKYFKFLGDAPTLANANAFGTGNNYVKILIPYDYISNYQTGTNWSSTTNNIKRKQRGYKNFTTGDTLPSTDSTGNYTLTWYDDFNAILYSTVTGTPSATPVTEASHDGEYYCTIA